MHRLARRVSGARVVATFDVNMERSEELAAEHGARAHASAGELIEDPDVDAIVLASPGETHAGLTIRCIEAGKPVLCEKPLAPTVAECLDVLAAEVAIGRRLTQLGFMRRYDSGYLRVKQAIDAATVGDVLLLHCVHRNAGSAAGHTSAMSFTDSAIHEIDTARWLTGEEVVSATVVPVRSSPAAPSGLRDPQILLLGLGSGAVVEIEVFVNCGYGYDVRCEVVGSAGTVSLENPSTGVVTRDGARREPVPEDWRIRFGDAYLLELQEWVDGVARGEATGPSVWDGYAATVVACACVDALDSGREVAVKLVERPPLYS